MAAVTEELRVSLIVAGTVSDLEELVALGEEVEELRVVVEGVGVEELRVVVVEELRVVVMGVGVEELRVVVVEVRVEELRVVVMGVGVKELRVVVMGLRVEELRVVVRTGVGELGISNGEGHLGGKEEPFSSDSAFLSPLESSVCATFPTAVNSCSSSGESRRRV